jgi:hypothetical protein
MRKKVLIVAMPVTLALILLTASTALGTGARTGGVILQNIDPDASKAADINITFYNEEATPVATHPITLSQFAAAGVNAGNVSGLGTTFVGSVVVSSDKLVGAVADDTDSTTVGMYNGFTDGATEFYLPAIYNYPTGWQTEIWVQCTEDVSGASSPQATVTYMDRAGAVAGSETIDLATNATVLVDPADTVTDNWAGGVIVSSAYKVAAIARVTNGDITEMYNGFAGGDATVYAPSLYKNAGGWYSGIMVQNLGTSTTTVTIDFYDRDGNWTGDYTYPSEFVQNGVQAVNTLNVSALSDGWAGTAVVESSNGNPIIAVIDVTNQGSQLGNIYNAALESDASTEAYVPAQYQYASVGGWTSGVLAMNIDSDPTTVTYEYYDRTTQALTTYTETQINQYIVFAMNTINVDNLVVSPATTWAGATKVTTNNTSRVVVVANVTNSALGKTAMYSAFPKK